MVDEMSAGMTAVDAEGWDENINKVYKITCLPQDQHIP